MGQGSCCGGLYGFGGTAQQFPWVWSIDMFIWFGFDVGVLGGFEFGWVKGVKGVGVGGRWWHFVRGKAVGLGYCCGGFGGFAGTARVFP